MWIFYSKSIFSRAHTMSGIWLFISGQKIRSVVDPAANGIGASNQLLSIATKRSRWERFTSKILYYCTIYLLKALWAPSLSWKQMIGSPYCHLMVRHQSHSKMSALLNACQQNLHLPLLFIAFVLVPWVILQKGKDRIAFRPSKLGTCKWPYI